MEIIHAGPTKTVRRRSLFRCEDARNRRRFRALIVPRFPKWRHDDYRRILNNYSNLSYLRRFPVKIRPNSE